MLLHNIADDFDAGGQRAVNVVTHRQLGVERNQLRVAGRLNQELMESVVGRHIARHVEETPPGDKRRGSVSQMPESGQLFAGETPHGQLHRAKLQRQTQVERVIHVRRHQVLLAALHRLHRPGKFFIVEVTRHHPDVVQIAAHRVHHRRRATEIDIHLTGVKQAGINVLGDITFMRVTAFRVGNGAAVAEVRQTRGISVESLQRHQIFVTGHAKNQMYRLGGLAVVRQLRQHRQERSQTGPSRQKQRRAFERAQVEAAHRPAKSHRLTDAGVLAQPGRHQPLRHVADHERHLVF